MAPRSQRTSRPLRVGCETDARDILRLFIAVHTAISTQPPRTRLLLPQQATSADSWNAEFPSPDTAILDLQLPCGPLRVINVYEPSPRTAYNPQSPIFALGHHLEGAGPVVLGGFQPTPLSVVIPRNPTLPDVRRLAPPHRPSPATLVDPSRSTDLEMQRNQGNPLHARPNLRLGLPSSASTLLPKRFRSAPPFRPPSNRARVRPAHPLNSSRPAQALEIGRHRSDPGHE